MCRSSVPPGEGHGPDEGGEQEYRRDLERHHIGAEDGIAHLGRALDPLELDLVGAERVGQHRPQRAEEEQGNERRRPALVVVEVGAVKKK